MRGILSRPGLGPLAAAAVLLLPALTAVAGSLPDGHAGETTPLDCVETVETLGDGTIRIATAWRHERTCPSPTGAADGATVRISASRIVLTSTGVVSIPPGLDGDADRVQGSGSQVAVGERGGDGGDLVLDAETVVLRGRIRLGSGGDGGDARSVSANADATAVGGAGGRSGRLHLQAERVIGSPTIVTGDGGPGGRAYAVAGSQDGDGEDRDRRDRGENGTDYAQPDGGDARARALNESKGALHGEHGGNATAIGGRGGEGAVRGGDGGNATAIGGDGGDGRTVREPGRDAGHGGAGGEGFARAGRAGPGRIGGRGGQAVADGGDGGDAHGDGIEDDPVDAGRGGLPGPATARGGTGGSGNQEGGDGGDVTGRAGDGGDGGDAVGRYGRGGDGLSSATLELLPGREGYGEVVNGSTGNATVVLGDGGDGGNGTLEAGDGGVSSGHDPILDESRYTIVPGEDGEDGRLLDGPDDSDPNPTPVGTAPLLGAVVAAVLLVHRFRHNGSGS